MGTRAQFFVGDPQDLSKREWLGCVAWDGYPDGDIGETLRNVASEQHFRKAIAKIKDRRKDFCDPATMSFPFPWEDDLFLTDVTYAWFGDKVQMTRVHRGWIALQDYLAGGDAHDAYNEGNNSLPSNVPAPTGDKPKGPDSIIILTAAQ